MTTEVSGSVAGADVPARGRPGRAAARAVAALAACALAAGCASTPTMVGEVTRFHAWQAAEPLTFAFRGEGARAASLEHRSYEALVRRGLVANGFTEAEAGAARYRVEIDYRAVPENRRLTEWWPSPAAYGPGWGWGPGPWIGPRPPYPYWRWDPWWGMPPMPVTRDTTLFRHELRVDLYDVRIEPPPGRKVHEARAVAYAATESLPRLMPGLAAAVFVEFPGPDGATRRVEVPLEPLQPR